jgi:hypothetical protein
MIQYTFEYNFYLIFTTVIHITKFIEVNFEIFPRESLGFSMKTGVRSYFGILLTPHYGIEDETQQKTGTHAASGERGLRSSGRVP